MINGIKKIWIIFERNNQRTKAGYGSNRRGLGAKVFQPSQTKVHTKITKKKPIVPTRSVIQIARRSSCVSFCRCSILTCRSILRTRLSSWSGVGTRVSLIALSLEVDAFARTAGTAAEVGVHGRAKTRGCQPTIFEARMVYGDLT